MRPNPLIPTRTGMRRLLNENEQCRAQEHGSETRRAVRRLSAPSHAPAPSTCASLVERPSAGAYVSGRAAPTSVAARRLSVAARRLVDVAVGDGDVELGGIAVAR